MYTFTAFFRATVDAKVGGVFSTFHVFFFIRATLGYSR